jgi:hypothetical protein
LLRESGLLERRRQFQQSPARLSENSCRIWGLIVRQDALLISLFAYENAGLASWLDAMAGDSTPTHLLVPEGRILAMSSAGSGWTTWWPVRCMCAMP